MVESVLAARWNMDLSRDYRWSAPSLIRLAAPRDHIAATPHLQRGMDTPLYPGAGLGIPSASVSSSRRRRPQVVHHHRGPRHEPDLLAGVREALREDHPLALLMSASQYLEISTERPLEGLTRRRRSVRREQLVESFIGVVRPETTALLQGLTLLVADEPLRSRIGKELSRRSHRLPNWIGELPDAVATATMEMTDVLGDGDNVMIELSWPSGRQLTVLVYIDHNLGTVVKDAFPIPAGISEVVDRFEENMEKGTTLSDLDPADARARIDAAISEGEHLFPPLETDTWPGCRGIVEWAASMLPEGGLGYKRTDWSEAQREDLVERFFASSFVAGFDPESDHRYLADALVWFGCDYGPGDPLRWSPVSVEILLADWFPRKVVDTPQALSRLPDTLRAFIRFAHAEKGIPAEYTTETLDAVERWAPDYLSAISDPDRPIGLAALVTSIGGRTAWDEDDRSHEEHMLDHLAGQVGGREVLDRLDHAPLPDEPFDWSRVPADITTEVEEVLALTDRCCDELLDIEYRTITRRLLARAAVGDPEVFRRGARADYTAAALVWMAGKANDLFREVTVKSLTEWFGLSGTASQRAKTLRKAAGLPTGSWHTETSLGDPGMLHSKKRHDLITWRDRYRERISGG
jgi:hypothetical protein